MATRSNAGFFKTFEPQLTTVATATGPAIRAWIVATPGERVVEPERRACFDDRGFAHLKQWRMDLQRGFCLRRRLWWRDWPFVQRPEYIPRGSRGSRYSRVDWRRKRYLELRCAPPNARAKDRKIVLRAGT